MDPKVDDRLPAGQGGVAFPLLERFPRLADRVARIPLTSLPTPVERLPIEGRDAWIKRDDVTAAAYGGNKVRKLEFLLPAAKAAGVTRLITVGALGSHHALATTIYGRALGFDVTVVLLPQTPTDHVRDVLAGMHAHGAEVRLVKSAAAVPAGVAAAKIAHRRESVRVIAPGGSDPIGTLGYVNAALELAEQCARGECPVPDEVHVAAGTLGTAAGLAIGFALADLPTRVVGHRITSRVITNRRQARRLTHAVLGMLRDADPAAALPAPRDVATRFSISQRQIGRGYGFATDAGVAASDWFAAHTGIHLDATYTAKAAAGFIEAARSATGPILYWHTLSATDAARAV
jgi:1-aminocyclopropane-1-carboxylate deaminase/D-cysteine desulfhydrase-like pyridoxal-dependent ACC family enzyme